MKSYPRKKPRNLMLSIIYKVGNLLPISSINKFKFFAKLQWVFWRLAREQVNNLYSINENPYSQNTIDFLKNDITKNDSILDLGCGDGLISYLLSFYCKNIIGIDYDKKLILGAKFKYKEINNISFEVGIIPDIFENDFQFFDLIICSHIIEHIEDYGRLLNQIRKYGKKIFIEVPDFDSNDLNFTSKKFNVEPTYTDADHIHEFDRSELLNFFNKNNFTLVKEEYKDCVMRFIIKS